MADDVVKIIRVETGGSEQTVKGLKDEINSLRDALLNTEKGSEEYKSILEQLIDDQKRLTDTMRAGQKEMSAAEGSYNALVNQMAALKKVWRETTDEVSRKELGNQIKEINDKLKGLDASIGDFRRQVGDYSNSITAAFSSMGGAAKGMVGPVNAVKGAFTALSSHPIVAVLTALAALLINGISKGFKTSEENTNKLRVAFSAFQAIGDAVLKLFQGLAGWIAKVAEAAVNFADKLGLITPKMKERQKLMEKQIELEKKQRDATTKTAEIDKEAADLRAKASDEENYSIQERIGFLQEAQQKEEERLQIEKDILEQQVAQMEAQLALTDSTKDELDELNRLKAQVIKVNSQISESQKKNNRELSRLRKRGIQEQTQERTQMLNLEKELIKQEYDLAVDGSEEQLRLAKELRTKELEIEQAGFKQKIKNRKEYERAIKLSIEAYNNDIEKLDIEFNKNNAEKKVTEYFQILMRGVRKNSSKYYTLLGDEQNALLKNAVKGVDESDHTFKERLESYRRAANDYYDQGIQAAEQETSVINQIILNATRPMSAYYAKQKEQLKTYYDTMSKLSNESDDEFKQRQDVAWKNYLDSIANWKNAIQSELEANQELAKLPQTLSPLYGIMNQLDDDTDLFKDRLDTSMKAIKDYIKEDIATISETLINEYNNLNSNGLGDAFLEAFGGLLPTPENIMKIMEEGSNEDFQEALVEIFEKGLVPEDLINSYIENLRGLADTEAEINKERLDSYQNLADGISGIMGGIADSYETVLKAQVENGKKSEAQAEDEFENVIKPMRIAEATVNTIAGAVAAFMGWQDKGQPWGAIIGAVQAAAVTAAGIAQITQIANTKFGSKSTASVGSIQMAQVSPTLQDYQPDTVGIMTGQQETEELANAITSKPIRAFVVESDINAAQQLSAQRLSESTF